MKLGPVTKLDKRNRKMLTMLTMTSCRQIVTLLKYFRFMANLEQFGSCNLGHNIFELYNVLIQTRLTTSKTKRDI